jgi:hypothetical protein
VYFCTRCRENSSCIQMWQNDGHFAWRRVCIYDNISLNISSNQKCFRRKLYRKSKNTFCDITFFPENRAVYEIMWKNIAEMGRLQITIWRIRIACWITKVTNTHSECVMFFSFSWKFKLHSDVTKWRALCMMTFVYLW